MLFLMYLILLDLGELLKLLFIGFSFMKSLDAEISLAGTTLLFLLLSVSLVGLLMPTAAVASLAIDDTTANKTTIDGGDTSANNTDTMSENNTSSSATTSAIDLGDEPFAVGHYRTVSNNMTSEGRVQFTFEGNTSITIPNSTEMITTIDAGQGNVTFLAGGAVVIHAQIHMSTEDGSENATGDITEYMNTEASTGIGLAYFSTSSTENLGPLNNRLSVFLDEIQPNEDSIVRFFEWENSGSSLSAPIGSGITISSSANNTIPSLPMP
jgi:hypothetical protein